LYPEWQKKALTAHMLLKPSKSSEDKAYRGLAYHDEWTQTHSTWTNNHRSFFITLRDVYNKTIFANKLLIHKSNCDEIADVYGFMTAFRYDMQIRMNAFAHRLPLKDGAAVPDITVKQDVVVEQCYSIVRSHGETGWKDNHYAPGGSHATYDPDTGTRRPELSRSNSVPNQNNHSNNRQQNHVNQYNNAGYGFSNHQERRKDSHRSRYGGNMMQGNFHNNYPNNYYYNTNYDYHSQTHQQPSNFVNRYDDNNNGGFHQPMGDSRKRFRSSGKIETSEKPPPNMASGSKP
jgi:hypothetical protein